MSGSTFLDTNIFIYSFDSTTPKKQAIAQKLITNALEQKKGVISTQVINEFLNVALRKFTTPLKPQDAKAYLEKILYPLCEVFPDLEMYQIGLEIHGTYGYSLYDSLILAATIKCGATTLLSEDLQHGQTIMGVTIINPFL